MNDEPPFRVLFVCMANLYRSPLAEHFLRHALATSGRSGWRVASAGIGAVDGSPMAANAAAVLEAVGAAGAADLAGWTTTHLRVSTVASADLVLTAEAFHRSAVLRMFPAALPYTLTLRQAAAYARSADDLAAHAGPTDWFRAVLAARPRCAPLRPPASDIADPAGKSLESLQACADSIREDVLALVAPLAGTTAGESDSD